MQLYHTDTINPNPKHVFWDSLDYVKKSMYKIASEMIECRNSGVLPTQK